MPAIHVEGLSRRRGSVDAVRDVSFTVETGEIFGLLGPNGAGKTSTIEVLEGLEPYEGGLVEVLGQAMPKMASVVKEKIGVQLQVTGLPRYLTVIETLNLFTSFYRNAIDVSALVDRLGLEPYQDRVNSRLSGGERQRVALALALINDPEILFLDEPAAGLDPYARRELWNIIRGWRSAGKTVFLTTHDMHEAEALCDRVAIMDEGQIAAIGTVASLVRSNVEEQAIWISPLNGLMPEQIVSNLISATRVIQERDDIVVYSRDALATMAELLELRTSGVLDFESIQLRTASLEDAFFNITGRRLEQ